MSAFQASVTATLFVKNWTQAVEFYKSAFGANEQYRVEGGGVCQLSVSGADFWVAEESPENQNFSPELSRGCSVRMLLIVEDPAAVCKHAVAAGATQISAVQFPRLANRQNCRPRRPSLGNRQAVDSRHGAVGTANENEV